jgi:hypothetical protein
MKLSVNCNRFQAIANRIGSEVCPVLRAYWCLSQTYAIGLEVVSLREELKEIAKLEYNLRSQFERVDNNSYKRTSIPNNVYGPDCVIQPDVDTLRERIANYNQRRQWVDEFATELRKTVIELLASDYKPLDQFQVQIWSCLKALEPHEKWKGCKNENENVGSGYYRSINGSAIANIDDVLFYRFRFQVRKGVYTGKRIKGIDRVSVALGQQLIGGVARSTYPKTERVYDSLAERSLRSRFDVAAHKVARKYVEQFGQYHVGCGERPYELRADGRYTFKVMLETQKALQLSTSVASPALSRLVDSLTMTNSRLSQIPIGRPRIVGSVTVNRTTVNVLKTRVYLSGSSQFTNAYFLGLAESEVTSEIVRRVEWYHNNSDDDTSVPQLMQERCTRAVGEYENHLRWSNNQTKLKALQRSEIAAYAIRLKRVGEISMLDSKAAGNCLPGTIQFCEEFGVECPNNWTDHRMLAHDMLRVWRDNGWKMESLFLRAIACAEKRVQTERTELIEA